MSLTPVLLLVLESIGTQELILIAIAALVLFGPRKLPEIGRTLGKYLADFRRVSDEFKNTWQTEVELEEATQRRSKVIPDHTPATSETTSGDTYGLSANTNDANVETVIAANDNPKDDSAVTKAAAPPLVATPADSTVARGAKPTSKSRVEATIQSNQESPERA